MKETTTNSCSIDNITRERRSRVNRIGKTTHLSDDAKIESCGQAHQREERRKKEGTLRYNTAIVLRRLPDDTFYS